jgi:hypothetical protein
MERKISTSAQRLQGLLGVRRHPIAVDASHAFQRAGLKVDKIGIQAAPDGDGYVLTASGRHEDETPFAFTIAIGLEEAIRQLENWGLLRGERSDGAHPNH